MTPSWRVALLLAVVLLASTCSCFAVPEPAAVCCGFRVPASLNAPGGPVRIRQVPGIVVGGDSAWGVFFDATREIWIDTTATAAHEEKIYYHEATHAALSDAGLDDLMDPRLVEAVCNALATARVAEQRPTSPF